MKAKGFRMLIPLLIVSLQVSSWAMPTISQPMQSSPQATFTPTLTTPSTATPVAAMTATAEGFEAVVNTTDDIDDGVCNAVHCSLREAISAANKRAGPDTITFDPTVFPLSGTGVIKLASPLPDIYDGGTTIDTTGAKVTIDGGNLASFPGDIEDIRGLYIRSSGNTVRGIRIIGMPGHGIGITSDEAFRPRWPADNNTLIGVTVVNNGYGPPPFTSREDGIVIEAMGASSSASSNRVINCTIEDNADDGIIVQVREGGAGNDNIIIGNIIRGNAEDGIEIDAEGPGSSASRNTVANNTIEGHQYPGSLVVWSDDGGRADENILRSNIVAAGLDRGIWIVACNIGSSTTANIVINNIVENHVEDGISVESHTGGIADGNIVKGNTIQRSGGVGIHIATNGNLIYHNDIIDNDTQARDYGSNHWDNEGEGNYWSDYQERYPAAWEHPEHKGIWDTPYWIPGGGNKDMYPLMPPTPIVRTKEVTDVTMHSATLNCDFTLGDYDSVEVYFEYRKAGETDWTGTTTTTYNASGSHSDTISGLQPGTDYKFRAQVRYDDAIVSGEQRYFTTFDTTAPTVSITGIAEFVKELTSITGTALDNVALDKVQVVINNTTDNTYWDGNSWVSTETWLDATGTASWSFSMPTLTDGKAYEIKAKAIDKAGNESAVATDSFTYKTAPARGMNWWIWPIIGVIAAGTIGGILYRRHRRPAASASGNG